MLSNSPVRVIAEGEMMSSKPGKTLPKQSEKARSAGGFSHLVATVAMVLSGFVFAIASFDFSFFDFRMPLNQLAGPVAIVFVLCIAAATFLSGRMAARGALAIDGGVAGGSHDLEASIRAEVQIITKTILEDMKHVTMNIDSTQKKVDHYLESEFRRLNTENQELRDLKASRDAADLDSLTTQLEKLRVENSALHEKIVRWAIESVDGSVERRTLDAA